jgi:hypothetical protein
LALQLERRVAKKRYQADHRADTKGGALSGLPHAVADSPAYLALAPFDRCVLSEILRRFNGYNNGEIAISYEELGSRLRGANNARPNNGRLARSIAKLIDHGFLAEPTPGSWLQRRAREYRLTFISSGKAPPYRPATNEYRQWAPTRKKNDGYAASPEQTLCGDAGSPEAIPAGDAGSPDNLKNGSFPLAGVSISGDAESPLICKPYGAPKNNGAGWWMADRRIQSASAVLGILLAARQPANSNLIPFPKSGGRKRVEKRRAQARAAEACA